MQFLPKLLESDKRFSHVKSRLIYTTSSISNIYKHKLQKLSCEIFELKQYLLRFELSEKLNKKIKESYKCPRFKGFCDFSKILAKKNCLIEDKVLTISQEIVNEEFGSVGLYLFIDQNKPSIESNKFENPFKVSSFSKIVQYFGKLKLSYDKLNKKKLASFYKRSLLENPDQADVLATILKHRKLRVALFQKLKEENIRQRKGKLKTKKNTLNIENLTQLNSDSFDSLSKNQIINEEQQQVSQSISPFISPQLGNFEELFNLSSGDISPLNESQIIEEENDEDSISSCCSMRCDCNLYEENYEENNNQQANNNEIPQVLDNFNNNPNHNIHNTIIHNIENQEEEGEQVIIQINDHNDINNNNNNDGLHMINNDIVFEGEDEYISLKIPLFLIKTR